MLSAKYQILSLILSYHALSCFCSAHAELRAQKTKKNTNKTKKKKQKQKTDAEQIFIMHAETKYANA